MEHRGGCSADDDSGDGAGVMTQIPWKILSAWAQSAGLSAPMEEGKAGVGMVFLPRDPAAAAAAKALIADVAAKEGLPLLGWRTVPVDESVVGKFAKATEPGIEQVVLGPAGLSGDELERKLYMVRTQSADPAPRAVRGQRPLTSPGIPAPAAPLTLPLSFLSGAQAGGEGGAVRHRRTGGPLLLQPVRPGHRLQGHAALRGAGRLLQGPAVGGLPVGLRHLPPPVQHQHDAQVAAGAADAVPGPQRGDQHAAGQPQLDGVPRGGHGAPCVGRP